MLAPGKFRHKALQKMSSPEQLDQMLRISPPRRWIGLIGLLLIVAGVVAWSAVAAVPTTLSGPGYLLPQGGLRQVQAPVAGTVSSLDLAVGAHVVAGQSLGTIHTAAGSEIQVVAPETGVITETDTVVHGFVNAGARVALVQPVGWPLVVYAYVPTDVAAGLRPGVPVHVEFGAGIGARFGYAKGTVASVSEFPATLERLNFILQDSSVVDTVRKLGPTNEIAIVMEQSAHTASGLAWGSGSGPPAELPAGLPAKVKFIVGQHHPIDNVL